MPNPDCPPSGTKLSLWGILKATYKKWSADKGSRLAAALSYYAIFSIGPLLIIALFLLSLIYGHRAATHQLEPQIASLAGPKAAEFIHSLITFAEKEHKSSLSFAGVISTILIVYAATNMFVSLQDSLNTVFNVEIRPGRGLVGLLKDRALTFLMVFVAGGFVIASIGISTALIAATRTVAPGNPELLRWLINAAKFVSSAIVFTGIFALMFKYLPDIRIPWKDTLVGATLTAVLFSLARVGLVYYLARTSTAGLFGAAGSLVIVMLFIYYSSQIFFIGAEFTHVWACRGGTPIRPATNARIIPRPSPPSPPSGPAAKMADEK